MNGIITYAALAFIAALVAMVAADAYSALQADLFNIVNLKLGAVK